MPFYTVYIEASTSAVWSGLSVLSQLLVQAVVIIANQNQGIHPNTATCARTKMDGREPAQVTVTG